MSYGVQIFNEKGQNIVEMYYGTYVIDVFHTSSSGSKSYSLSSGEYIRAIYIPGSQSRSSGVGRLTYSGNTVSWNNVTFGSEGTVVVLKGKNT